MRRRPTARPSSLRAVAAAPPPPQVDELSKECENGRLMRLMVKLDQIHNRTEEDMVSRALPSVVT